MFSKQQLDEFLTSLVGRCAAFSDLSSVRVSLKSDRTLVTEVDHALSDFIKAHPLAAGLHLHSEEEHTRLAFPGLIVDPLDGTRDFVEGRAECAVSVAWMASAALDGPQSALVYNPFTGFALHTGHPTGWVPKVQTGPWSGLVSRSEWGKGLFDDVVDSQLLLAPRGSIAFKLALLAAGSCDFVVSRRPKNVWDIAAGTLLAHRRGMEFWSAGKRVTSLEDESYPAPLFWGRPETVADLRQVFFP
jgi:myo-inositol-1(or 4)-monophosphatase